MHFLGVLSGFLAAAAALSNSVETAAENTVEIRGTPQCGISGYYRSSRPYFSRKAVSSAKACGDTCWNDSRCNSYSFGQGTCSLFGVELSRNIQAKSYSPISFYEKSCAAPSPPPTKPKQSCQLTGYDNANSRTSFFTKSSCGLPECQTLCKSKIRCQSYKYGQGTCVLFTAPVSRGFVVDKRSPFTFYDRGCQLATIAQPKSTTTSRVPTPAKSSSSSSSTVSSSNASTTGLSTSTSTASTTTAVTTTASTTASGANTQETTFENVKISFKRAAVKKRQDGSVSLPDGFISRALNAKGQRVFITNAGDALEVRITVPQGGSIIQTRLNLLTDAAPTDLPALALVRSTNPAQAEQLFLGAALAGAPPADGSKNSLSAADSAGSYTAQSAIWTVNLQTLAVSAQWINADGTATGVSLLAQDGVLFMASDVSAFPNADQLTPTANFADPAATCATITNYEYVNGQCVEKCRTGLQRIPGTIICAQPNTLTCGEGQRAAAGLCVCTDTTKQLFNGTCVPRCNMSLKETINSTTGQCGCRADMARNADTNVCQCPTGQQDTGRTCECPAIGQILAGGVCRCQDWTAVVINGVCVSNPAPQNFNDVLLSFVRSPAAKTKRQAGSQLDVSYGYISADLRATGERYLTNDQQNSLTVSFSVPAGSTVGQQINLVGPTSASPDGIHTLSLLFDINTLQQGVDFASGETYRLLLGSSAVTPPGSRAETRFLINSSMQPSRAPANAGKAFAGETAVWTIDTKTGVLDAYWIDTTGTKSRVVPMANGDSLFFAPEAISNQVNGTLLQIQAEIPGTPSPGRG